MGLLQRFFAPRIVHSLPGRMRVHIPGMKDMPEELREIVERLSPTFREINGIRSISFNYTTGNLLIYYGGWLNEKVLLEWLSVAISLVVDSRSQLQDSAPEYLPTLLDRLQTELIKKMEVSNNGT